MMTARSIQALIADVFTGIAGHVLWQHKRKICAGSALVFCDVLPKHAFLNYWHPADGAIAISAAAAHEDNDSVKLEAFAHSDDG